MQFTPPLQRATLLRRYKRFLADVELPGGQQLTVHCPNTGSMKNCGAPGDTVWLSTSDNPKRKYQLSWELTQTAAGERICVNTARANTLCEEAINSGVISELQGYARLRREVRYGAENSRIDVLLTEGSAPDCYIEVKSCTLLEDGMGYFPDAVSTRGQKHLRELMSVRQQGYRAVLLFAVLHTGIQCVQGAAHIDPAYAELLEEARAQGVEILSYRADITPGEITLQHRL